MKRNLKISIASVFVIAATSAAAREDAASVFADSKYTVDWRIRYESGAIAGTRLLAEVAGTAELSSEFNSTTNGHTNYPVVADPGGFAEINLFALINESLEKTRLSFGRQRLILDESRFVGNVGWRQNEQTFDGLLAQTTGEKITASLAWFNQVDRIFGPDSPNGEWNGDVVLLNASKTFGFGMLTAFAYGMEFDEAPSASNETLGFRMPVGSGRAVRQHRCRRFLASVLDGLRVLRIPEMALKLADTPRLVVVGNGMAGMRAVEELLELVPDRYAITVFGSEPRGNYNRILLSPLLSAEKTLDDIMLNTPEWYVEHGIELFAGRTVDRIDRARSVVVAGDGFEQPYDRLLLATGSNPFMLPLPGADLSGVIAYRDVEDVDSMIEASRKSRHAVVIGGGLLGLEAAYGLQQRGMDVTVVHVLDSLMERQLDPTASGLLRESLESRGLKFRMSAATEAILGTECVEGVRFKDGTEISADLVVMAVGIRPNIALAKNSGLACDRGVLVDDTMQTFDPKIYAVGECVQHRGACYGLVAPLFEQAKVVANHLAEIGIGRYSGSQVSTKLKVTGIDLFSAGDFVGDEDSNALTFMDPAKGVYKKIVVRDDRIQGALLYGNTVDGPWYFQLLRDGTDISSFRENILFGQAHIGDSGTGGADAVTFLSDTAEICGCNGVCKGDIVNAISTKKLFTLDDVRAHTKASSSCGSCTGLVEQLLANTLGGDYSEAPAKRSMCPCTIHTHEEVRQTITRHELKSIPDLMHFLEWQKPDGCHRCRPALNFYLLCAWPGEYVDDKQSRFINERAHGNIQRDGTYSVIPRIWGGVTTPGELRAIADVAEKYEVRTVKFTGGQRLDLLGIKKEDLPSVWGDLNAAGLVSGHAYGKALRTVKTCVGSEWCRFGTQDSTGLGIKLERMTWGSWHPHKVKLAVSGCPRNCAEATIKDLGVVCVDSGYELHVGGNGGIKIRATDFLCKVATEDEVLEYTAAFLQLYREDARYLERTAPWIERVGLSHVRDRIVDDSVERARLAGKFLESQRHSQTDPWAERAQGKDAAEFAPLALEDLV